MAKEILTGGDGTTGQTGLQFRTSLNSMFTELYNWLHPKQHALNSTTDHSSATGADKGKLLGVNSITGVPELKFLADADIPVDISRKAALDAHLADTTNPHDVTAEQLGISVSTYDGGAGIGVDETNHIYIFPTTLPDVTSIVDTDKFLVSAVDEASLLTLANLKTLILGDTSGIIRGSVLGADSVDYGVEVTATGLGITATLTAGNTLTFDIPLGVRLLSAKVRLNGYSTLIVRMGTTDMANSSAGNRWMPIVQAWREDTSAQLMGVTAQMDSGIFDKFTISGLIYSTANHIRLSF